MPILNNLTVNEIVDGQIPDTYRRLLVGSSGYISYDTGQTLIKTPDGSGLKLNYDYLYAGWLAWVRQSDLVVNCDSIGSISVKSGFAHAFQGAALSTITFNGLTMVDGQSAFEYAFADIMTISAFSNNQTVFSFPALSRIEAIWGFQYAWSNNKKVQSVSFPALTTLKKTAPFSEAFQNSSITELYLGGTAEITITAYEPFGYMFDGCSQNIDVYAPAANQAAIEAMSGYPNFGGTGNIVWHWRS